ncbi:MAG TPA: alpha-L-rhamnosidase N-terminal domain-containing protein, partial [Flavilitoribacter sp.]|nr:alpha-L-rhamnosidase N-terminal domain-containing protein [Flavilitoribacter sp.]
MKAITLLSLLAVLTGIAAPKKEYAVIRTSVDYRENPTGVDLQSFFFGWKLQSARRNVKQSAYRILLSASADFSKEHLIWDSGKSAREESILVPYGGKRLEPGKTYFWKVRSWSNKGKNSGWSPVSQFTTGLFETADWKGAQWIAYDKMPPENRLVPGIHLPGKAYRGKDLGFHKLPIFRKEFAGGQKLKKALAFVTGLGHYTLYLNGKKIGNSELAPGWTHYDAEALYNTYDCTDAVKEGKNALAMMLGNGFLVVPNSGYRKVMTGYANPMLKCRLTLIYEDGREENIVSDTSWKTTPGPITYSSIYSGEHFDARLEPDHWMEAGLDDDGWDQAIEVEPVCRSLKPERDYPVEIMEELTQKEIHQNREAGHSWIYDFGQNASGMFRITVQGNRG